MIQTNSLTARSVAMRVTIFYSWQSDLPNNTNRGFIERALEKAIASIGTEKRVGDRAGPRARQGGRGL
jgi:hypothetical protein